MRQQRQAFMSYAPFDNDNDGQQLTALREKLRKAVQAQTGNPFPIFQDVEGIRLGEHIDTSIKKALSQSTFLIPILTPSFFTNTYCRDQLQQFLEHEARLGRTDLILPIYYITCKPLESPAQHTHDSLVQAIAGRRSIDWRPFRFKDLDTGDVREQLARVAQQIEAALERVQEVVVERDDAARPLSAVVHPTATAPSAPPPAADVCRQQQDLLATHRRTLAHVLKQQAALGSAYAPPGIAHGIDEARAGIAQCKQTLRGWGVAVDDHPDDGDGDRTAIQSPAPAPSAPQGNVNVSGDARVTGPAVGINQGTIIYGHAPHHEPPPSPSQPVSLPRVENISAPDTNKRLRIFLCYAQNDQDRVQELYDRLLADGFDPWFDEENLLPGHESTYQITQAVRDADVFLACLSPHAISTTGHLNKQITIALDIADEQPQGRMFIIPVRLEPCAIPDRLSRWHVANLYEKRGYERLRRALHARANQEG